MGSLAGVRAEPLAPGTIEGLAAKPSVARGWVQSPQPPEARGSGVKLPALGDLIFQ